MPHPFVLNEKGKSLPIAQDRRAIRQNSQKVCEWPKTLQIAVPSISSLPFYT